MIMRHHYAHQKHVTIFRHYDNIDQKCLQIDLTTSVKNSEGIFYCLPDTRTNTALLNKKPLVY